VLVAPHNPHRRIAEAGDGELDLIAHVGFDLGLHEQAPRGQVLELAPHVAVAEIERAGEEDEASRVGPVIAGIGGVHQQLPDDVLDICGILLEGDAVVVLVRANELGAHLLEPGDANREGAGVAERTTGADQGAAGGDVEDVALVGLFAGADHGRKEHRAAAVALPVLRLVVVGRAHRAVPYTEHVRPEKCGGQRTFLDSDIDD
jgi:hypothetical protein